MDELFIVASGSASLFVKGKVVNLVSRGQCAGLTSFLDGQPFQFTIITNEKSVFFRLKRENYDRIFLSLEKHFERHPLLTNISDSNRRYLFEQAKIVTFTHKEDIIIKGEKANQFYIILEGSIKQHLHDFN